LPFFFLIVERFGNRTLSKSEATNGARALEREKGRAETEGEFQK
jgi:hypothetical protein